MEDFLILIRLAWRNIWRNKRRTLLTLLTVIVGCTMIIFINAINNGAHEQMIEDAIKLNVGHLQIQEKDFWDTRSIESAFKPNTKILNMLRQDNRIAAYGMRIQTDTLISFKEMTIGAYIQAVNPEDELKISELHKKISKGRYLSKNDNNHVVLGTILAKNLGAKIGDTVTILSQGFDGSIAAEKLVIVGLLKSGNMEYDQNMILMPYAAAETTFSMMRHVNSLTIRCKNLAQANSLQKDISRILDENTVALLWENLIPEVIQFIVIDDIQRYIFDFILFMVVAFGIMNTMQMSVFERTRELGIMLSIGTQPEQVLMLVMFESFFLTVIGILIGNIFGSATSYYFQLNPMDFSDFSSELSTFGLVAVIFPAKLTFFNLTITNILILLLALIFSYFPAKKAAELNPLEAIRYL